MAKQSTVGKGWSVFPWLHLIQYLPHYLWHPLFVKGKKPPQLFCIGSGLPAYWAKLVLCPVRLLKLIEVTELWSLDGLLILQFSDLIKQEDIASGDSCQFIPSPSYPHIRFTFSINVPFFLSVVKFKTNQINFIGRAPYHYSDISRHLTCRAGLDHINHNVTFFKRKNTSNSN